MVLRWTRRTVQTEQPAGPLLLHPRVETVLKTDVLCGRIVVDVAAGGVVVLQDSMPSHMQPIHGAARTIVIPTTLLTDGM